MTVKAVIEMREGDVYKYELNKETGRLAVDRVLNYSVPTSYGFVPGTLSEDGDPLDIFVYSDQLLERNCEVEVEIIGGFSCEDNGAKDDKLVGVLLGEPAPVDACMAKIRTYLSTYKKSFKILNEVGPDSAYLMYDQSVLMFDYALDKSAQYAHQFVQELEDDESI